MRITKYLHSCLLVEEKETVILLDPGIFTYQEKVLDINKLSKLDYILITHEHPDHLHIPFIKELVAKFPNVKIITNSSIVAILQKENIKATTEGNELIQVTPVKHERVFDRPTPQNVMFEIFGKLAQPGDSMSFETTKKILAIPLVGPSWSTTQAVEKALSQNPKIVIPIHDWMWRDEWRVEMDKRLKEFFAKKDIDFKSPETGVAVEV